MPEEKTKICEQCGGEFEYRRTTARFCSNTCRQRAHRVKPELPRENELARLAQQRRGSRHERKGGLDVLLLPGDSEEGVPERGLRSPN